MKNNAFDKSADIIVDGRQSEVAAEIQRGTCRLLKSLDQSCLTELTLANNRRADIVSLSKSGLVTIVEIKSCVADYRADNKWQDYRTYCDEFYFAVPQNFPIDMIPDEEGLIIADKYGGEILRTSSEVKLPSGRRKALTQRFARTAALRLQSIMDPDHI